MSIVQFFTLFSARETLRKWVADRGIILLLLSVVSPGLTKAEIIWDGGFETGDFTQYPNASELGTPYYWGMPEYARPPRFPNETNDLPPSYYGDGSALELVKTPVRNGNYAAKFTVKNSANGAEPSDCDNGNCTRRRSELWMHKGLSKHYNGMPYMGENWISMSAFIPSDWEDGGSGWGPAVLGTKPFIENGSQGLSAPFSINIAGSSWSISHRWSPVENPIMADVPWQQQMFYTNSSEQVGGKPYPSASDWPQGLEDYPNPEVSQKALGSLNKGGWTDWVINIKWDARGSREGGTGFINVWKREDSGPWIHVLRILPKVVTRGDVTFDRGIGYNSPAGPSHNGGFGPKIGLYMEKNQVWNSRTNKVIYIDNVKVGGPNTRFEEMSPDGSAPDGTGGLDAATRPNPPLLTFAE